MKRLIIIAGASGAGKSFLLQQTSRISRDIVSIKKLSTRPPRPYEDPKGSVDLIFNCSEEDIKNCTYAYTYDNHSYGIQDEKIKDVLLDNKMPFVIVRDCNEIVELKEKYPDCLVLYLQSGYSGEDLKKILRKQGRSDIDIETRDSRIRKDAEQYRMHFDLFDYVLINYYDKEPLIDMFKSILKIEKNKFKTIANKVFVMMSFKESLKWIYDEIELTIDLFNNNNNRQIIVERIDDRKGKSFHITNGILEKINEAELIICDLTDERPNVYYELGYTEGIKKNFILTANEKTKIHFDIIGLNILFYKNSSDLRKKLNTALKAYYEI